MSDCLIAATAIEDRSSFIHEGEHSHADGTISSKQDIKTGNISLKTHTHTGNQGSATSVPVG